MPSDLQDLPNEVFTELASDRDPVSNALTGTIFDDLKERISSPFIKSYVISFIIANWRIPVGLAFLSKDDLKARLIADKVEYVQLVLTVERYFVFPMIGAIIYCFGYPWLRNLVKYVQAWWLVRGNRKVNPLGKGFNVSLARSYEMRDQFVAMLTKARQYYDQEFLVHQHNAQMLQEKSILRDQILSLERQVYTMEALSAGTSFHGNWRVTRGDLLGRREISIDAESVGFYEITTERLQTTRFRSTLYSINATFANFVNQMVAFSLRDSEGQFVTVVFHFKPNVFDRVHVTSLTLPDFDMEREY